MKKSGIVLLNKDPLMTSFDCIRALKRLWNRTDLGHAGTLDRFATGLLPVLAGEGLKLARFFLEHYPLLPTYWKSYTGIIEFGSRTETADAEGKIIEQKAVPPLTKDSVNLVMQEFIQKPYQQQPPRYSAKKIGGVRASDLARHGIDPHLKPVVVHIRSFVCHQVEEHCLYFNVECSKGTYVRTLAEDLAQKLNTVGFVKQLQRTAIGNFELSQARTLDQIKERSPEESIIDLEYAVSFLPKFQLSEAEHQLVQLGKAHPALVKLANSSLAPNVYYAHATSNSGLHIPTALFELQAQRKVRLLRAFQANFKP